MIPEDLQIALQHNPDKLYSLAEVLTTATQLKMKILTDEEVDEIYQGNTLSVGLQMDKQDDVYVSVEALHTGIFTPLDFFLGKKSLSKEFNYRYSAFPFSKNIREKYIQTEATAVLSVQDHSWRVQSGDIILVRDIPGNG